MPARKKYFIQEHLHREVFHGGICNIDAEKVFLLRGYQPILFPCTFDFSIKAKWQRLIYLIKILFTVKAGDLVVFQFPLYARIHKLLTKLLRIKGVHVVCFIIDIDGLRVQDDAMLAKEKKELRWFSFFISLNPHMSRWLQSLVPNAAIEEIQFHDYLTTPVNRVRKKGNDIVFAGYLQKSPFIQHLEQLMEPCPNTTFLIYGPDYPQQLPFPNNAVHKGIFAPYDIVHLLEGSFGLVWDGVAITACTGPFGDYLAFNSPHKLSLYILAGMPLIVPEMAACAQLVAKYEIGVTIKQLADIETVVNNITDADYQKMINNTRALAARISEGKCLGEALSRLEQRIYENS